MSADTVSSSSSGRPQSSGREQGGLPRGDVRGIQRLALHSRESQKRKSDGIDEEESIRLYLRYRDELHEFLKGNGDAFFDYMHDSDHNGNSHKLGAVGLNNQGATCYLNSMLQLLFFTREIRENIQSWRFQNPESMGIPEQIQMLLCKMKYTICPWIDTTDLTKAFQWDDDEVTIQQDSNELFNVLLDILDASMKSLLDDYQPLQETYEGSETCALTCLSCRQSRWRTERFLSLSLPIPVQEVEQNVRHDEKIVESAENTVKSQQAVSIEDCLDAHFEEEAFLAENALDCEHCGKKQPTMRNLYIGDAPRILLISLQRLSFNMKTLEQEKVSTSINVSTQLDVSPYVVDKESGSLQYALFGLLVHIGGSQGGHYIAYVNPSVGLQLQDDSHCAWIELNDAVVCPLDKDLESVLFDHGQNGSNGEDSAIRIADRQRQRRVENVKANVYSVFYRKIQEEDTSCPAEISDFPQCLIDEAKLSNSYYQQLKQVRYVEKRILEISVFSWDSRYPLIGEYFKCKRLVNRRLQPIRRYTCLKTWSLKMLAAKLKPLVDQHFVCRLFDSMMGTIGLPLATHDQELMLGDLFDEPSKASIILQPNIVNCLNQQLTKSEGARRFTLLSDLSFNREELTRYLEIMKAPDENVTLPERIRQGIEVAEVALIEVPAAENLCVNTMIDSIEAVTAKGKYGRKLRFCSLSPYGDIQDLLACFDKRMLPSTTLLSDDEYVNTVGLPENSVILAATADLDDDGTDILDIFSYLKEMVTIEFNALNKTNRGKQVQYDKFIQCHRSSKLVELKRMILPYLDSCYCDVTAFHCKFNASGPQIKCEEKTLEKLGLKDGSILHLCPGAPLEEGQHVLKILRFDPFATKRKLSPFKRVAVNETDLVESLKERLWKTKLSEEFPDRDANHIRLRALSGSLQGKILCHGMSLRKCTPSLADGTEIAAEILHEPETPGLQDILISVAFLRKSEENYICLPVLQDVLINKKTTVEELLQLLDRRKRQWLPNTFLETENSSSNAVEEKFRVAKCNKNVLANPTGPAIKRLRWCIPPLSNTILAFPLALRDQSALLIEDTDILPEKPVPSSSKAGTSQQTGRNTAEVKKLKSKPVNNKETRGLRIGAQ